MQFEKAFIESLQHNRLETTKDRFADQVMRRIAWESSDKRAIQRRNGFLSRFVHSDFAHFLVASATTYLFVASGIFQRTVQLNARQVNESIQTHVGSAIVAGGGMVTELSHLVIGIFN